MSDLKQAELKISELFAVHKGRSVSQYGVKGMKWGRRRAVGKDGRVIKKGTSTKNVKDYSDQELRDVLNRADLERRFAQLNTPTKSKARQEVETILANTARQQAQRLVNEYAAKGLDALIKNATKKK